MKATGNHGRLISAFFAIFFLASGISSRAEMELPRPDGIIVTIVDLNIVYFPKKKSLRLESSQTVLSGKDEWLTREVGQGVYHLKHNRWRGFFWLVDTNTGIVSEAIGRVFGADDGGVVEARRGITAEYRGATGRDGSETVRMKFNPASLRYDLNTRKFLIEGADTALSYGEDWEIKEVADRVFQFRHREWKGVYWEIDISKAVMKRAEGVFGSRGAEKDETPIMGIFSASLPIPPQPGVDYMSVVPGEGSTISGVGMRSPKLSPLPPPPPLPPPTPASPSARTNAPQPTPSSEAKSAEKGTTASGPRQDLGFAGWNDKIPESEWTASEKSLYRTVLKQGSYDVMVAPLQVQDYAFDRVNRSLITRRLAAKIERETDLRVADPTLVARALGQRSRRLDEAEVYRLADELKVKYLVRTYAGHNLDEALAMTVLFQVRDGNGRLGPDTGKQQFDWSGRSFSDSTPPAEVFGWMAGEVFSKLRLPIDSVRTLKESVRVYEREANIKVPETVAALFSAQAASPVLKAYYLQLIGVLYPDDHRFPTRDDHMESEGLFERSLIALDAVSPKSPDYPLLKARAYFYLNSRPAALEALKDPQTPEEKAFMALLNGNLPEMERWTAGITSPLHKLISEIELNDLRDDYGQNSRKKELTERLNKLAKGFPGWEAPVSRRLAGRDRWNLQPNILVKNMLDNAFPVPGLGAEDFLSGRTAVDRPFEVDGELERYIYRHYRKVLEDRGLRLWTNGWSGPAQADYLDLIYYTGETNIWKQIDFLVYVQGRTKDALDLIGRHEALYDGNLKLMRKKADVLASMMSKADVEQEKGLIKNRTDIRRKLCYWSQGQSPNSSCEKETFYDADYPMRASSFIASDRKVLKRPVPFDEKISKVLENDLKRYEIKLMYTHNDFGALEYYYNSLIENKMNKEADRLMEANRGRFAGSPAWRRYTGRNIEKVRDASGIERFYRQAMESDPDEWKNYEGLGELYVSEGEIKKAFEAYGSYPLFQDPGANRVTLSNYAISAGINLYRAGAIEEARHFFKLSAGYNTGSGAEMSSAGYLAISHGDYRGAAGHFLQLAKRYGSDTGQMLYMSILHLTGYHKEAWAALDAVAKTNDTLISALVGGRMEGMSREERGKRLLREGMRKLEPYAAQNHVLMDGILDRHPEQGLVQAIRDVARKLVPGANPSSYQSEQTMFAEGYYLLRTKDYEGAYHILNESYNKNHNVKHLPYIAMAGAMSDKIVWVEGHLKGFKLKNDGAENFHYHLSKAIILGVQKRHDEALKRLVSARYGIGHIMSDTPVMPWYMLVDASEWLYDQTGYAGYRDLALEYARIYQKIMPVMSWAYAVEAKYTANEKDRLRALAITLYLDKDSERISGFSESEKKKALEWLEGNNPFLMKSRKGPVMGVF